MAEDRVQRRLTTIMAADVVGYSRLMALDEEATIRLMEQRLDLLRALLPRRTGRLFKTMGDGALAEFESPVEAVRCAIEFQEAVRTQNDELPEDRQIRFRIGINLGDVVSKDSDLLGDAVNVASRLQQAAPADGICVSNGVYEQLIGKLTVGSQDLGLLAVKNIPRPVHARVLQLNGATGPEPGPAVDIHSGRVRVLIPTTSGLVEVLLLIEEEEAIGRSVSCIGGTAEVADIDPAYDAFVARPTGIVERLFGHRCYRLDLSGRIDAGASWQVGVLAAHALQAAGRLAQEYDTPQAVVWATGTVRAVDLAVGEVGHVRDKIAHSLDRLDAEVAAGRRVLLALPAANAAEIGPQLRADLAARKIELIECAAMSAVWHALGLEVAPAAPQPRARPKPLPPAAPPRRRLGWIAAAVAVAAASLAGAYGLTQFRPAAGPTTEAAAPAPPPPATPAAETPAVARPTAVSVAPGRELVAEKIPFVRNSVRRRIRDEYVPGPDHKAIAISINGTGNFVVGRPSAEQARADAIERCNGRSRAGCAIYAIGSRIVSEEPDPPMPPEPLVPRLRGPVIPLDADRVPLLNGSYKRVLKRQYAESDRPKAAAMSPTGHANFSTDDDGEEAAVRRVLEVCGRQTGAPCRVFAVMDRLVVPVPEQFAVKAWLSADQLSFLPEELRGRIARDYETGEEWRALAVATNGRIGIGLAQEGEIAASEAALKDCVRTGGTACEIFAIGPYRVARPNSSQ